MNILSREQQVAVVSALTEGLGHSRDRAHYRREPRNGRQARPSSRAWLRRIARPYDGRHSREQDRMRRTMVVRAAQAPLAPKAGCRRASDRRSIHLHRLRRFEPRDHQLSDRQAHERSHGPIHSGRAPARDRHARNHNRRLPSISQCDPRCFRSSRNSWRYQQDL